MITSTSHTISEFKRILLELPADIYSKPSQVLSGSSIGQHTRHIIELFQELLRGYPLGDVSYDSRRRDKKIETNIQYAVRCIDEIELQLNQANKTLNVHYEIEGKNISLDSNYHRELMYNLEHTIHHQALIRIGIETQCDVVLPAQFGVAPSTMQYRTICAQ